MAHPCEEIYTKGADNKNYGSDKGVCRITGKESTGVFFDSWVRKTFNDHDSLNPGTIISNEALFCFDESSEIVQLKTGKEKPQRFRTYSHIIKDGEWFCLTKRDKRKIFELITEEAELICLTETGQKHILFKHKQGLWQLDDLQIEPDIEALKLLHFHMCKLLDLKFSQAEVISGNYQSYRIVKSGLKKWKEHEDVIGVFRGRKIFDFTSFMLYSNDTE